MMYFKSLLVEMRYCFFSMLNRFNFILVLFKGIFNNSFNRSLLSVLSATSSNRVMNIIVKTLISQRDFRYFFIFSYPLLKPWRELDSLNRLQFFFYSRRCELF